jgi:hypothetical protein
MTESREVRAEQVDLRLLAASYDAGDMPRCAALQTVREHALTCATFATSEGFGTHSAQRALPPRFET